MSYDVFISHSQHDSGVAAEVCKVLEEAGIRCWIAPRDIVAGRNWGAAIVQAISASRLLVLIFSAQSNTSPQVLREVERATSRNVTVLPYRIEPVEPSPELEYYLSVTHWLNAFDSDHAKNLADLVRTARDILGMGEAPPAKVLPTQQAEQGDAESYRSCPYCAERIRIDATICRFCNRDLTSRAKASSKAASPQAVSPGAVSSPGEPTRASALKESPITAHAPIPRQEAVAPKRVAAPPRHTRGVLTQDVPLVVADVDGRPSVASPDRFWPWIDRLLPASAIVVGSIVTMVAVTSGATEISLIAVWAQLSSMIKITGVLCPIAAAGLCGARYRWSKTRSIVAMLAVASIAAPFIGLSNIRQGIESAGRASLGAVAGGLTDTMFPVPFVCGAGLALAIATLPRQPHRRYQTTVIALGVLAAICVLLNAIAIRDLASAATATTGTDDSVGLAGWLVWIAGR